MSEPIQYTCQDCDRQFDEFEAGNASLCHDEFNPACPQCGGDWVEKTPYDEGGHE